MLELEHIQKAFDGVPVLKDLSLQVEDGEIVSILGPSGCGKTTLLRQAKPELTPAGARDGSIYYMDQSLAEVPGQVSAMEIGYVQQNPDNQIVTDYVWHKPKQSAGSIRD